MDDEGQWFLILIAAGLAILVCLQLVIVMVPQRTVYTSADAGFTDGPRPAAPVRQAGTAPGQRAP